MKSFALCAALAVTSYAQEPATTTTSEGGMSTEDINSLFDIKKDGMLIAPSPMTEEGSTEMDHELQENLEWINDIHQALCDDIRDFASENMEDMSAEDLPEGAPSVAEIEKMLAEGADPAKLAEMVANGDVKAMDEDMAKTMDEDMAGEGDDDMGSVRIA